jgi:diguanylate cyclase (GGDEF)-like protein
MSSEKKQQDLGLRMVAETQIHNAPPDEPIAHSAEYLLHELQVHQIELEMQNDALRQTQIALTKMHERYVDLYEFAPVGYLSLSKEGVIKEINLTGANLLRKDRCKLLHRSFISLIIADNQTLWKQHFLSVKQDDTQGHLELILQRGDGTTFPALLDWMRVDHEVISSSEETYEIRVTLVDITERKQTEQRFEHLASHDVLTNLPNRNLLLDRIEQALIRVCRNGGQGAVLFIDLDKFKIINDSMGHDVGDSLLKMVSQRLVSTLRSQDTVGRQGGDEFIVLLPTVVNTQDVETIAQKLLNALLLPYHINDKKLHISASIGIAMFPQDAENASTLLKCSDIAMYYAKEIGCNSYQFFTPQMDQLAMERQIMGVQLHQALELNEQLLYYQPVIDMTSGKLVGLEALLRWQHSDLGLLPASKFISLIEEIGLIMPIGEWVLRSACMQFKAWQDQGYDMPQLMINVSVKQIQHKMFTEVITRILDETGVEVRLVNLEIIESVFLDNSSMTLQTFETLHDMGLKFSIDDFGVGYSSMNYLKHFPINTLKIDQSFVRDVVYNSGDIAIIRGIINLAHNLQMKVIAEGVETEEQHAILAREGCDQYQGYYFSKPLPASEIVTKLRRH